VVSLPVAGCVGARLPRADFLRRTALHFRDAPPLVRRNVLRHGTGYFRNVITRPWAEPDAKLAKAVTGSKFGGCGGRGPVRWTLETIRVNHVSGWDGLAGPLVSRVRWRYRPPGLLRSYWGMLRHAFEN